MNDKFKGFDTLSFNKSISALPVMFSNAYPSKMNDKLEYAALSPACHTNGSVQACLADLRMLAKSPQVKRSLRYLL